MLGDNLTRVALEDARKLPFVRQPVFLLFLMAFAMPIAFSVWSALLNNFVIEAAGFTGVEIGWLHTVREIPGFLAIGVIFLIIFVREQVLGLLSLILLGVSTGLTAYFPTFGGILTLTLLGSIGFHYYETVNQSLQLQWLKKEEAPQALGWITAVGSFASLIAYGLLVATWKTFDLSYSFVYMTSGGICALIAVIAFFAYPQFEAPDPQIKKMILRRRYWLYYLLQFMSGARRQIFIVFAAFAPLIGKAIGIYGERNMLVLEYLGLTLVFLAYGGIYYFGWGVVVGAVLYVANHLFFSMAFAIKTYFQKIADPGDIAPTAAVAFTINHIAAVFLPALLGSLWVVSPGGVFVLAAMMAGTSLLLACLIPRHPRKGNETRFSRFVAAPAE